MKLFETRRPLVDLLDSSTDEARIIHNWAKIEARKQRQGSVGRALPVASALVALTVSVVAVLPSSQTDIPRAQKGPLSLENQPMLPVISVPENAEQQQLALSDGSRLTVAPGATLRVTQNTDGLFKTALGEGWVRFNVVPNRKRAWVIDAGIASIYVMGTQFTVKRTQRSLTVRVHRGTVQVRPIPFKGEIAELTVGESETWTIPGPPTVHTAEGILPPLPADDSVDRHPSPLVKLQRPRTKEALTAEPTASSQPLSGMGASDGANDLLDQVDLARKQKRYRRAAALLVKLMGAFPDDPVVGLAALTLARIRLNRLNQAVEAAEAFQFAANAKALPASLREQAAARTVEAYRRAGKRGLAAAMRNQYKQRYPQGEWLTMVERWGAEAE